MATEQVPYEVTEVLDEDMELRRYGPVLIAETEIEAGSFSEASDIGFRRLAGYIFGDNAAQQEIAMTAPVLMESSMAMGSQSGEGSWRMAFAMPSEWTMDSLPRPNNEKVQLVTLPEREVAAVRFAGRGSPEQFSAAEKRLRAALEKRDLKAGRVSTARYNAPWVPPFLRRNEVLIDLETAGAESSITSAQVSARAE